LSETDTVFRILAWPVDAASASCVIQPCGVAFIVGLVFAAILFAAVWSIKRGLFREAEFSVFTAPSVMLGITLGLLCSFAVPQFESMYKLWGVDFPAPTVMLLQFRELFLWGPLILMAVFWRPLQSGNDKARWLVIFSGNALILSLALSILYLPLFRFGICI
jgi:hypothetical protein